MQLKKPQNSLKIVSRPVLDFKIMHVHIYCFFNSVTYLGIFSNHIKLKYVLHKLDILEQQIAHNDKI